MDQMNEKSETEKKTEEIPRPKSHRVFAWIAIILLVSMYTVTLIAALSGSGTASELFMMSLGATILIPCLLWGYICLWKVFVKRDRGN